MAHRLSIASPRRIALTGAPGAGKTSILRRLADWGYGVVEEAATEINAVDLAAGIAEPHRQPEFLDRILALQIARLAESDRSGAKLSFHDRTPVCTLALAEFLEQPVTPTLAAAIEVIQAQATFEHRVFFVRGLGFIANTPIRRISLSDALRFEQLHEAVYRRCGFELAYVEPGPVDTRAQAILDAVLA